MPVCVAAPEWSAQTQALAPGGSQVHLPFDAPPPLRTSSRFRLRMPRSPWFMPGHRDTGTPGHRDAANSPKAQMDIEHDQLNDQLTIRLRNINLTIMPTVAEQASMWPNLVAQLGPWLDHCRATAQVTQASASL